jgi:hypothetical protein
MNLRRDLLLRPLRELYTGIETYIGVRGSRTETDIDTLLVCRESAGWLMGL